MEAIIFELSSADFFRRETLLQPHSLLISGRTNFLHPSRPPAQRSPYQRQLGRFLPRIRMAEIPKSGV